MGTHGAITRRFGDSFKGRYHHWDSYPKGLGKALWDLYHGHFNRDLEAMLKVLIDDHPAGWSTIVGKDFSLKPGFIADRDDPCQRCGVRLSKHFMSNADHLFDGGPKHRRPYCYCHGDRRERSKEINEFNAAYCGCEYIYCFDEANRIMSILSSYNDDGSKMAGIAGYGNPNAVWKIIAVIPLDGQEPMWDLIRIQEENRVELSKVGVGS